MARTDAFPEYAMTRSSNRLPQRRHDLILRPIGSDGSYVVKDPSTGAYFHMGDREQFLLNRLDGEQTIQMVLRAYEKHFNDPLTTDALNEFLPAAATQNLVPPATG